MFHEFDSRRRYWLQNRLESVLNEFNPIDYQGNFDSKYPKTGLRVSVPKEIYGIMPNKYYLLNSIKNYGENASIRINFFKENNQPFESDSAVVRNVLDTEFAKIILDLIMLQDIQNENYIVSSDYDEIVEKVSSFNKPILLLDMKSDNSFDWNSKERNILKDIFFSRNTSKGNYRKAMIKVNNFALVALRYHIPLNLRVKFPHFEDVKGIFIDQDMVEYRVKEPLRVEWRTKKEDVKVVEYFEETSNVVFDKDFFDFRCFTLAEIKNHGSAVIWKYTNDELKIIKNSQEKFDRLTKKET